MKEPSPEIAPLEAAGEGASLEYVDYDFGLSRRDFMKSLGAGLVHCRVSTGIGAGERERTTETEHLPW